VATIKRKYSVSYFNRNEDMIYWCKKYTVDAAVYRCLTTGSRFVLIALCRIKKWAPSAVGILW